MRTGGVERAGDPPAARRAAMAAGRRPARGAGLVNLAATPSGSRPPQPLPATTRQNRETAAVVLGPGDPDAAPSTHRAASAGIPPRLELADRALRRRSAGHCRAPTGRAAS